jgi:thiol-disulfide isomerase/thioredoxin
MIQHMLLLAAAFALAIPRLAAPAAAQDAAPECASALWLDQLAVEATVDAATPPAADAPAWIAAELTDACTGEAFALADFAGKVVYVEPMATWCVNCKAQMERVREAAAQIPEAEKADVVLVALSSEVDLPREALSQYAAETGFPMIFAVMPADYLRAIVDDLGQEIAVPPTTPHFTIAPDGTVSEVRTGASSPEELLALFAGLKGADAP